MSWTDFVKNKIISYTTETGHLYKNACQGGAIVGTDGTVWASQDLTVDKTVVEKLNKIFQNKGATSDVSAIDIGGDHYMITNFNADSNSMYLKCAGGGACVALSNKAYIIGTFKVAKTMAIDGVEKNQNVGYCNSAVENLQQHFISIGY